MFRTFGVVAVALTAMALLAGGGRIGQFDVTQLPLPLVAFVGVSVLVLLGLRSI